MLTTTATTATLIHKPLLKPTIISNPFNLKTLIKRGKEKKELHLRCSAMENNNSNKKKKKNKHGTSRRSILKKTFSQEQVQFSSPVSDDPTVAIIGGGMSGLMCALALEKRGVRSTVFDTGVHGLGGRMGTRIIDPQPLVFDHAAQFFTVSDPQFAVLVDEWFAKGLVRQWPGTIGELEGGHFVPLPSSPPRYIGANGMRPLSDSILSEIHVNVLDPKRVPSLDNVMSKWSKSIRAGWYTQSGLAVRFGQARLVNVERPCWISKLDPFNGMWHLSENKKHCGQFDALVIAHNGKCANRLLASSGLPLIARQMKRLELSSIWALLAAFEDPLPIPANLASPFEGAFIKGVDSVSWMANNTKKLSLPSDGGPHCWTFFSTAAFGKKNKVPQENVPVATSEKVKEAMLAGIENALRLPKCSLQRPFYTRLQLWGAALPTNTPGIPCIFDPHGRAGICGDWLLGSSLEAAALSGIALANHMADYLQSGGARPDEFAVGLHNEFHPLEGHDIGQFPGLGGSTEQMIGAQSFQLST